MITICIKKFRRRFSLFGVGRLIFLCPRTTNGSVDGQKEGVSIATPRGNQMSLTEVRYIELPYRSRPGIRSSNRRRDGRCQEMPSDNISSLEMSTFVRTSSASVSSRYGTNYHSLLWRHHPSIRSRTGWTITGKYRHLKHITCTSQPVKYIWVHEPTYTLFYNVISQRGQV